MKSYDNNYDEGYDDGYKDGYEETARAIIKKIAICEGYKIDKILIDNLRKGFGVKNGKV